MHSPRVHACAARACFAALFKHSQGGLQGTVTDRGGHRHRGQRHADTRDEPRAADTSSDEGFYSFSNLSPGRYTLTAEKAFQEDRCDNLTVNAESVQGLDVC